MFQSLVQRRRQRWAWMFGLCSALGAAALVAWLWLLRSLNSLPSPRSSEGRDLLYHYNRTSHDLWLILLGLAVVGLLWFSRRDPQQQQGSGDAPPCAKINKKAADQVVDQH